uniref:Thioredoxin domain-containing protein n=2 Tax=Aplanochytrium stocchinoi TaxID=215587 RepID=A0A7S3PPQ7_9STRA|mmetsp:Transcript_6513/g.8279  ORF Transcript_6513/g.8279 Transcript_6513/m.8279 type:complete len:253 (-) Transcript_6513:1142-1900(-)|eukprot:CAMPEP_0204824702 /NCGR_PEP_ID=MMETSP1346-20131115/2696_1 /ASSEMBLY_ACC=CAM_ASM_000771 /TAXON_ID=215587 /ORGANISM="Aplanochytrium stocchinoi, Strain GSBS06" /LENGTH=252 /DNA_ID=CAMNT_0051951999 /DNA_START=300 /DNA_END=1058 /DNA_ORIENTATION=-
MGNCFAPTAKGGKSVERRNAVEKNKGDSKNQNLNQSRNLNFSDKYGNFSVSRVETSITNNVKTRVQSGKPQVFKLKDIWNGSPVVFYLFRRFGCPLCRNTALKISNVGPILEKHGVKLVGIGLSYRSIDGMIQGNYWGDNDIYVNEGAALYKALELKIVPWSSVVSKQVVDLNAESKESGVVGDFHVRSLEQGRRLGGLFVISKSGDSLYEWRQQRLGEVPPFNEIFKALQIDTKEIENFPEKETAQILTKA